MTSGDHLTQDLAAGWRERRLPAKQIAEIAGHLAQCPACREAVSPPNAASTVAGGLATQADHLSYEEMESLAEQRVLAEDLILLNQHLRGCPTCARELADLTVFAQTQQRPNSRRWWIAVPVIAALAAAAIVAVRDTKPAIVASGTVASLADAQIVDSGRRVWVDGTGRLHGLEGAPTAMQASVAEALRSGALPVSSANEGLAGRRDTLLGSAQVAAAIQSFAPAGVVTPDLQPMFRWSAPADATGFVVAVFTKDFQPVATSPALNSSEWLCTKALREGTTYVWTVTVTVAGKRITAPSAPEPEARFRVATQAERAELDAARSMHSDLAVATVATRAGMYAEADQALSRLGSEAPVAKLRESLRQIRAKKTTGKW